MLQEIIKKIIDKENLKEKEAYDAMNEVMLGNGSDSQIGAFLIGLRMKGETVEEITGFAKAMRDNALILKTKSDYVIDTCGTGGDGGKTFNISTAVALVAAAAGVKVAKHGNRAVSSKSGSADTLEKLGFNINLKSEEARNCIDEKGMAFLFAQKYHNAMKNVAAPRKELGTRTVFNLLGPLTNPAFVKGQVLGVYDKKITHTMAKVLSNLGCERAMVVCGEDGLDEITTTSLTYVSELKDRKISEYTINPEDFEIRMSNSHEIEGGTSEENAATILEILQGKKGAKRDIVILNSAAALYVGKVCENMKEGVRMAEELIDSGKVYKKMNELRDYSNKFLA
ncbi:anthranilate phosphoribosyltransferase [Clostridium sp. P21]|uniref:Anthranilate phosphoribosyltransferase n=1 Tax=Clostridium muellerianum TaxID=2716538 RepID=A0A7Y0EHM5_9CLOT|nr:anthranilate phosphoribosyltransferase [Clostridium muellerianum]NMM63650.1 anthranilate phosphoribosyltransferase [Clostridium muellerianum]